MRYITACCLPSYGAGDMHGESAVTPLPPDSVSIMQASTMQAAEGRLTCFPVVEQRHLRMCRSRTQQCS